MDFKESRGKAPPPAEYLKYIVLPRMNYPLSEQRAMGMDDEHILNMILRIVGY